MRKPYGHRDKQTAGSLISIQDLPSKNCQTFLHGYTSVFTLNYDLLLYWVRTHADWWHFDDGFCAQDKSLGADILLHPGQRAPPIGSTYIYLPSSMMKHAWLWTAVLFIAN